MDGCTGVCEHPRVGVQALVSTHGGVHGYAGDCEHPRGGACVHRHLQASMGGRMGVCEHPWGGAQGHASTLTLPPSPQCSAPSRAQLGAPMGARGDPGATLTPPPSTHSPLPTVQHSGDHQQPGERRVKVG